MDLLKAATDWTRAELFSTPFFVFFGIGFIAASVGFWQLGKTAMARAYIIPTLVAGILLVVIGLGLFFTNRARAANFPTAYAEDPVAFTAAELARTDGTLREYQNIVFTVIPLLITGCAIGILFLRSPGWRASLITAIALLVVILLIDGTAHARIAAYRQQLQSAATEIDR